MSDLAAALTQSAGANPSAVLDAFVPQTALTLRVIDILRLERLGSPLLLGQPPKISDLLIAYGVMTDWEALHQASKRKRIDDWLDTFSADLPASEITRISAIVTAAVEAAFRPVGEASDSDPQKKTSPVADGGSPSSPTSATTTAGPQP